MSALKVKGYLQGRRMVQQVKKSMAYHYSPEALDRRCPQSRKRIADELRTFRADMKDHGVQCLWDYKE
jgi:hypothetical protein